jgi:redox-sensitive bicupin YhaK (pirin superfamily)
MTSVRLIEKIVNGAQTMDGDGVKLTRIMGTPELNMLDPFLLLDFFGTDEPLDYIGGFPPHPHRGFETVTYMLAGKMRHKDSAGNEGVIEAGGIQWMTAGKGIIHSEMPEQSQGLLAGFQLWVNLPASHKMTTPRYQETADQDISTDVLSNGGRLKVIAGKTSQGTAGVINNPHINPTYWDVTLVNDDKIAESIDSDHNVFIYVISGSIAVAGSTTPLTAGQLAVLSSGDTINIANKENTGNSRFILVGGKPLGEPVARGGPFVMNTREQVEQAFQDYKSGNFI